RPTTPPRECPNTTRLDAGVASPATASANAWNVYCGNGRDPPCPGRSGATHRPGQFAANNGSQACHTSLVAPSPCNSSRTGSPAPPERPRRSASIPEVCHLLFAACCPGALGVTASPPGPTGPSPLVTVRSRRGDGLISDCRTYRVSS